MRFAIHVVVALVLTALTQLGGVVWLVSRGFRRPFLTFVLLYGLVWGAVQWVAPMAGRVSVPCSGAALRQHSVLYCALMRNFVVPEMKAVAEDAARQVAAVYPGSLTLVLDGGFPFGDGFPLLPHLSHDDGEKLDFAFYYAAPDGAYAPGQTRSPLGYFAFEALEATEACPPVWMTMRWRLGWLQPLMRDMPLERARTAALVRVLLADPRIGKVFVEPPLAVALALSDDKLRFQGWRAARHDDHIRIQL